MFGKIASVLFISPWFFVQALFAADLPKVLFVGDNLNSEYFPFLKKGLEKTFVVEQKQLKNLPGTEKPWNQDEGTSVKCWSGYGIERLKIQSMLMSSCLIAGCRIFDGTRRQTNWPSVRRNTRQTLVQ